MAACGGDDGESTETDTTGTEAPATSGAPMDSMAPADELGPPTGPEMVVGMVNTEGGAGLDVPDMRRFLE